MPKSFAQYREEAKTLNETAQDNGQPEPIPDYASLRLRPLAKKVLQARLDATKSATQEAR